MPKRPGEVLRARLNELVKRGQQERLSAEAGMSAETFSLWRHGKRYPNPDLSELERIAAVFKVPLASLISEEPAVPSALEIEKAGEALSMLPAAAGQVGAGPARMEPASRARRYAFRTEWLEGRHLDARRLVVARVARGHGGESMMPLIRPGSLLVVDRGPSVEGFAVLESAHEGKVFVVRHPDEEGAKVKRVYRGSATQLVFWSDNENTDGPRAEVVTPGDTKLQTILLGRVVWVGRDEE